MMIDNSKVPPGYLMRPEMEGNAMIGAAQRGPTARSQLLHEADKITSQDRNSAYGEPEDNFSNIAAYWNAYAAQREFRVDFNNQDVAHMMILMKMARLATNLEHRDSLLDIAGYAACGEDCRAARNVNSQAKQAR